MATLHFRPNHWRLTIFGWVFYFFYCFLAIKMAMGLRVTEDEESRELMQGVWLEAYPEFSALK